MRAALPDSQPWTWLLLAILLQVGGGGHLPAAPSARGCVTGQAHADPLRWQLGMSTRPWVGRLKGGSSDAAERVAGDIESKWEDYSRYEEPEELNYELVRNLTFKLPERSRRLGPMQMSWGLADPNIDPDDEWRNEIRVCA